MIWNRSLIKTAETRRLGLANQNVKVGDLVCVLYRCNVPVTLRRTEKTQNEIDQEVEEEIRYYQFYIASRIDMNRKRAKSFKDKRIAEIEKYTKWDEKMAAEWRKDTE